MTHIKHLISIVLLFHFTACAQEKKYNSQKYAHEIVVSDLKNPWGFVFLPDQSMLITEKSGELIHFKNGKKIKISGLPAITQLGQGGLLDIALHPNYKDNGWVYFTYASSDGKGSGANTALMRAKISNNTLTNKELLYKATPNFSSSDHFGSRIIFDENDFLFFSIGERGQRDDNPQDITRDGGKIYRLNDDGSIPKDNPFVNSPNAKKAIYSYGHRNPQGMILNPETNEIWAHEHGPKGGDEINIISAGKNYGWPVVTYGINYWGTSISDLTEKKGMESPIHHWTPSIAPSGMCFVTSDKYANWKGNVLVGSLKFQYLNRCVIENNKIIKEERILEDLGRVRSVVQGPDDYIYVGIENLGIVKIIPKN
ncbi:glucose/sorbosone dehydrogenase [Formosa agariphila KMM 3901]|uniref:Glucose/sorbosone dehydrogenase n=1 Tax=Formosa agariphila (strain DSM 15362 / KCTC 12365 / LMG 23005 / KMM 3901 / M-2Alg 35-1) TaxID=1347342 RepID=T2KPM9_FORAG|nr:PQQ-dependent sugar dehydrogenase [Formosa agariphila]CDF79944.1 glucose/sorbosone dehydrogenase [Formosa agariphila KMM 3901]